MLALINLIIRRTRLAFRTPARFALVLRSLPALPVPRHDFDRGFEATGAGCVCVGGCSPRDRNRGGGERIARVQPDPCPLVTRLGSGSGNPRLRTPLHSGLRSDGLADKGPRSARLARGHLRGLARPSRLPVLAGLVVSTWLAPGFRAQLSVATKALRPP